MTGHTMHTRKSRFTRLVLTIGLVATLALVAVVPVTAAGTATTSLSITGGTLTQNVTTTAPSATPVSYSSSAQTTTYNLGVAVNDARGLLLTDPASGWNLTITSTLFTSGGSTLPAGASTITTPNATCTTLLSCTPSVNTVAANSAVPAGATAPTAAKFYSTAIGTGGGTSTVAPVVTVTVPAFQVAGTYSSTLTIAVVAGP